MQPRWIVKTRLATNTDGQAMYRYLLCALACVVLYVFAKHKQLRDSKQKWRGKYAMSANIQHGYLRNGGYSV